MSDLITHHSHDPELDQDIATYALKEKSVVKSFVFGMIDLGGLLIKYQAKYKPVKKWTGFLKRVKLSRMTASRMIRLHEYSLETKKADVLAQYVTSMNKLDRFLALPEEDKDDLLEESISEQSFEEKLEEKENLEKIESHPESLKEILEESGEDTIVENPEVSAAVVSKQLNLNSTMEKAVAGLLYIRKGFSRLNHIKGKLSDEEKAALIEDLEEILATNIDWKENPF